MTTTYKAAEIREDGAYVESGENDTLIVDQLVKDGDAIGVFGFSFLQNNADRLKGASVGGVAPTFDAIASGDYPVSALAVVLRQEQPRRHRTGHCRVR